ncbi:MULTISPECIES: hypothetical protein [Pseudohongiella]|uniref:Uncharacterized protein n=1 Tax=marine sediment metagenome TaxID=412755 RepID=A0A0F9W3Q4_9ZZZZ|nr:hypothetical protein [Pseudohongiella sp.]HDZ10056.1 hypothetical protein [Pseudohongiella sp.]HEA63405.1 hypothetical protein [Pseudohongiella sp.]
MSIAQEIALKNRRHVGSPGVSAYDIDALVSDARDQCIGEWHYDDVGVSDYSFIDGSTLQIFHVVVTASDESDPQGPAEELIGIQSAPKKAIGRVGLLKSLTNLIRGARA